MNHHQKGTQVNHTTRSARTPFLRTVVQALRGVFGGGGGGGARSSGGADGRASALRLTALLTVVSALLVFAAPAAALPTEFGSEGEGAGQFKGGQEPANGIAINQESGDVYLADTANNRVVQFTAEGQFVRAWGWGVL